MQKVFIAIITVIISISCTNKSSKNFEVSGVIGNNTAKKIYLEEVPMATMQAVTVDSADLSKEGKYILKDKIKEATVYNLRLDKAVYPLAAVINDTARVIVNATLSKENNLFAESYDVKGSPASEQMKDFMYKFNKDLQSIFYNSRRADSLKTTGASDSVLSAIQNEEKQTGEGLRNFTLKSVNASTNPALTMFELGYYQSTANNPAFKIEALSDDEVNKIINDAVEKFPSHNGIALVKKSLDEHMQSNVGLVGQQAPEINLPDINGKMISLNSFRGKYVLVDFWASWCGPCRQENPNVVAAYNKYKDKNFTILGVSLDEEKDKWVKAIQNDGLTWTQVSDLKQWNSVVVSLYQIEGIPYNVLIDPNGKIIAESLRGIRLDAKLAEVLQ